MNKKLNKARDVVEIAHLAVEAADSAYVTAVTIYTAYAAQTAKAKAAYEAALDIYIVACNARAAAYASLIKVIANTTNKDNV